MTSDLIERLRNLANEQICDDIEYIQMADALMNEAADALSQAEQSEAVAWRVESSSHPDQYFCIEGEAEQWGNAPGVFDSKITPLVPASSLSTAIRERDDLEAQVHRMEFSDGDAEHWRHLAEKARADAIEEAAQRASEFTTKRQVMSEVEYWVNDTHGGDATVDDFVPYIADRIAAAIRALTQPNPAQAEETKP